MLKYSSLNIIPRPKRTSRLNLRLVSGNIEYGDNLDAINSIDIESDNSSTSSSYQSSNSSSPDESVNSILKSKLFPCKKYHSPNNSNPKIIHNPLRSALTKSTCNHTIDHLSLFRYYSLTSTLTSSHSN